VCVCVCVCVCHCVSMCERGDGTACVCPREHDTFIFRLPGAQCSCIRYTREHDAYGSLPTRSSIATNKKSVCLLLQYLLQSCSRGWTREEPGTFTQGVALFSLVPLVWESNPKLRDVFSETPGCQRFEITTNCVCLFLV